MLTESHLYQEIHEQPAVLRRFLAAEHSAMQELVYAINEHSITHVVIAARGASDNAGRYAKYVLGALNGLTVALATPSLFSIYQTPPRLEDALVLGISQSGKSPDIVAVLAEAQRQGALTAVITNHPTSDLAQHGDFVIDLHAGEEQAVAATKTYTGQLAAVALFSALLADDEARLDELHRIPNAVAQTLAMNPTIAQAAPRYRYMEHCVVIGRGYNYATAFELALKLKEQTHTIVEPYSSADFLHGPIALINPGFPVITVAPAGAMQANIETFTQTLAGKKAEIIAISDVDAILDAATIPLALPISVPEWLSPLTTIIPGQLFALHLAHIRHYDLDKPRGLQKVTETR